MGFCMIPHKIILPTLCTELQNSIRVLYSKLTQEQSTLDVNCHKCGQCCNFAKYDHQLWASTLELAFLAAEEGLRTVVEPGVCPYMVNSQCSARNGRTLGCRIFLCDMESTQMEVLHEKYFHQLCKLGQQYEIEIEYSEFLESLQLVKQ